MWEEIEATFSECDGCFYAKLFPYFAINCYSELVRGGGCEDKIKSLNKISIVLMELDYSERR